MISKRSLLITSVVGISALALATQGEFALKRVLLEGSSETYRVESKLSTNIVTPLGPQDLTGESVVSVLVKTGAVDSGTGSAAVDATTTYEKFTMDSMLLGGSEQKLPDPTTAQGRLDGRGRLRLAGNATENILVTVLSGANQASLTSIFLELPDKPVKPGDTWKVTIPANAIMKDDQTLTATLVGEKPLDGVSALEVSLSGTLNTEIVNGTMPESVPTVGGQAFTLKGSVEVKGTGFLDPRTGQTLKLDNDFSGKQTVTLTDMGLELEATSTLTTKSALQK